MNSCTSDNPKIQTPKDLLPFTVTKMPSRNILFVATAALAALASALPSFSYPEGVVATNYPDGLPESILAQLNVTSADLEARDVTISELAKRGDAGVYFCNDRNFQGQCVHIVAPEYTCVGLGPDLNDKVSSVGPDSPKYCLFYSDFNCNDDEGHFGTYSPGYSDLSSAGSPGSYWNDRISSYVCHPN